MPGAKRRPAAPGASPQQAQPADDQTPAEPAHAPESLSDLANYVASSGLTGTGLTSSAHRHKPAAAPPQKGANTTLIAIIVGVVVVLAAGGFALKLLIDSRKPAGGASSNNDSQGTGGSATLKPKPKVPNFGGIPLKGPSVVYLLDHGSGTTNTYDAIIGGARQSLESLGPQIKFQIIFWEIDEQVVITPEKEMKYATRENIQAAADVMSTVRAFSQSKIEGPMEKAIAQNPAEIVIVTGKYGLDDDFVKAVLDKRGASNVKIHTVSMGRDASPDPLRKVAERTGGEFRELTGEALNELLQP
jgi:hypothetical protein